MTPENLRVEFWKLQGWLETEFPNSLPELTLDSLAEALRALNDSEKDEFAKLALSAVSFSGQSLTRFRLVKVLTLPLETLVACYLKAKGIKC